MADDKSKRGAPDRRKVAGGEPYEVKVVAEKFNVSQAEVKRVIKDVGNSRAKIEAELRKRAK
jgi:hypothetical protein